MIFSSSGVFDSIHLNKEFSHFPPTDKALPESSEKPSSPPSMICEEEVDDFCSSLIKNKKLDENFSLFDIPKRDWNPLNFSILSKLIDQLMTPIPIRGLNEYVTFNMAELFIFLQERASVKDIEVVGGNVPHVLGSKVDAAGNYVDNDYVDTILHTMGFENIPKRILDAFFKKPSDIDYRLSIRKADYEAIRQIHENIFQFLCDKANAARRKSNNTELNDEEINHLRESAFKKYFLPVFPELYAEASLQDVNGQEIDLFITHDEVERKSLFVRDSIRFPITSLIESLGQYLSTKDGGLDAEAFKDALKRRDVQLSIIPVSDFPSGCWQPFIHRLFKVVGAYKAETINEFGWSLLHSLLIKGERIMDPELESILWQTFLNSFNKRKESSCKLPNQLREELIKMEKNSSSEKALLAHAIAYFLKKAVDNHNQKKSEAYVALVLQVYPSLKQHGYEDCMPFLWKEMRMNCAGSLSGGWDYIARSLDADSSLFDTVLAWLEVKAFLQVATPSKKGESKEASFIWNNHQPFLRLSFEGLSLQLPFCPDQALQRLFEGWQKTSADSRAILSQIDQAFSINTSYADGQKSALGRNWNALRSGLQFDLNKVFETLKKGHLQGLFEPHSLCVEAILASQTFLKYPEIENLLEKELFNWLKHSNPEVRKQQLEKAINAASHSELFKHALALCESLKGLPFQLQWAMALSQCNDNEKSRIAYELWLGAFEKTTQEFNLSFLSDLAKSRPDLSAKGFVKTFENPIPFAEATKLLMHICKCLRRHQEAESYKPFVFEAARVLCDSFKKTPKIKAEKTFIETIDWLVQEHLGTDFKETLNFASLARQSLLDSNEGEIQGFWTKWIKKLLEDKKSSEAKSLWKKAVDFEVWQDIQSADFQKLALKFSSLNKADLHSIEMLIEGTKPEELTDEIKERLKEFLLSFDDSPEKLWRGSMTTALKCIMSPLSDSFLEDSQMLSLFHRIIGQAIKTKILDEKGLTSAITSASVRSYKSKALEYLRITVLFPWISEVSKTLPLAEKFVVEHFDDIVQCLLKIKSTNGLSFFWKHVEKRGLKIQRNQFVAEAIMAFLDNVENDETARSEMFVKYLPTLKELLPARSWENVITIYRKWLLSSSSQSIESLRISLDILSRESSSDAKEWKKWIQQAARLKNKKLYEEGFRTFYPLFIDEHCFSEESSERTAQAWSEVLQITAQVAPDLCLEVLEYIPKLLTYLDSDVLHQWRQKIISSLFEGLASALKDEKKLQKYAKEVLNIRNLSGNFLTDSFRESKDWKSLDHSLVSILKGSEDPNVCLSLITFWMHDDGEENRKNFPENQANFQSILKRMFTAKNENAKKEELLQKLLESEFFSKAPDKALKLLENICVLCQKNFDFAGLVIEKALMLIPQGKGCFWAEMIIKLSSKVNRLKIDSLKRSEKMLAQSLISSKPERCLELFEVLQDKEIVGDNKKFLAWLKEMLRDLPIEQHQKAYQKIISDWISKGLVNEAQRCLSRFMKSMKDANAEVWKEKALQENLTNWIKVWLNIDQKRGKGKPQNLSIEFLKHLLNLCAKAHSLPLTAWQKILNFNQKDLSKEFWNAFWNGFAFDQQQHNSSKVLECYGIGLKYMKEHYPEGVLDLLSDWKIFFDRFKGLEVEFDLRLDVLRLIMETAYSVILKLPEKKKWFDFVKAAYREIDQFNDEILKERKNLAQQSNKYDDQLNHLKVLSFLMRLHTKTEKEFTAVLSQLKKFIHGASVVEIEDWECLAPLFSLTLEFLPSDRKEVFISFICDDFLIKKSFLLLEKYIDLSGHSQLLLERAVKDLSFEKRLQLIQDFLNSGISTPVSIHAALIVSRAVLRDNCPTHWVEFKDTFKSIFEQAALKITLSNKDETVKCLKWIIEGGRGDFSRDELSYFIITVFEMQKDLLRLFQERSLQNNSDQERQRRNHQAFICETVEAISLFAIFLKHLKLESRAPYIATGFDFLIDLSVFLENQDSFGSWADTFQIRNEVEQDIQKLRTQWMDFFLSVANDKYTAEAEVLLCKEHLLALKRLFKTNPEKVPPMGLLVQISSHLRELLRQSTNLQQRASVLEILDEVIWLPIPDKWKFDDYFKIVQSIFIEIQTNGLLQACNDPKRIFQYVHFCTEIPKNFELSETEICEIYRDHIIERLVETSTKSNLNLALNFLSFTENEERGIEKTLKNLRCPAFLKHPSIYAECSKKVLLGISRCHSLNLKKELFESAMSVFTLAFQKMKEANSIADSKSQLRELYLDVISKLYEELSLVVEQEDVSNNNLNEKKLKAAYENLYILLNQTCSHHLFEGTYAFLTWVEKLIDVVPKYSFRPSLFSDWAMKITLLLLLFAKTQAVKKDEEKLSQTLLLWMKKLQEINTDAARSQLQIIARTPNLSEVFSKNNAKELVISN